MKILFHRFAALAFLTLGLFFTSYSQDLRKQAEENPLSTVFYLLSTRDKDDEKFAKEELAVSYARAGRYRDVKSLAGQLNPDDVGQTFAELADKMLREGFVDEGAELVDLLKEKFDDEYRLKTLIRPLLCLDRGAEVAKLFDKLDESDQIDGGFEAAKIFLEFGRLQDALQTLVRIDPMVGRSRYDEDKAKLALAYAQVGEKELALKWMNASVSNLTWTSGKPEYTEGRILENSIETLRALGRGKEADHLLVQMGEKLDGPETPSDIALGLLRSGKAQQARAVLEKLPEGKATSRDESIRVLIDVYINLKEPDRAAALLRKTGENGYVQQARLISTVDLFIKRKENAKALSLLAYALRQTEKMDVSEPEDGRLSSSAKSEQARYQSIIALRYGILQSDDQALKVIGTLSKPYLRAQTLTEYVLANKQRLPSVQQRKYLDEAVTLLREKDREMFDLNRFGVYGFTARAFAEVGLPARSNEIFAQALVDLDRFILDGEIDSTLINFMSDIGVNFEKAKIKPSDDVRKALRLIIKNWEDDEY